MYITVDPRAEYSSVRPSQSIDDDHHRTQRHYTSTLLPHTPLYDQNCAFCAIFRHADFFGFLLRFWFLQTTYQLTSALGLVYSTYCTPKIHASRLFRPANSAPIERHRGTPTLCFQRLRSESVSTEARGRSISERIERLWDFIRASGTLYALIFQFSPFF
jgi:hypothetical protein